MFADLLRDFTEWNSVEKKAGLNLFALVFTLLQIRLEFIYAYAFFEESRM
jgi:hypothetical protein